MKLYKKRIHELNRKNQNIDLNNFTEHEISHGLLNKKALVITDDYRF